MGVLKPFVRTTVPVEAGRMPSGCFAVHRHGAIVCSTLPQWFPRDAAEEIARTVLAAFRIASETSVALTDISIRYSGINIQARDLRGGALIFLVPNETHFARKPVPTNMNNKNLEDFILHLETHIECWKQFNSYVTLARDKKFTPDDDAQFLDLKSLITQRLGWVLAWTLARAGQSAASRELLTGIEEGDGYVSPYQRATVRAALGDRDEAFEALALAAEARDPWMTLLRVDPMLDPLRDDARFSVLLARVLGPAG